LKIGLSSLLTYVHSLGLVISVVQHAFNASNCDEIGAKTM